MRLFVTESGEEILDEKAVESKLRELNPLLYYLTEKKGNIIFFCSESKKFFEMNKKAFEKIGKKYLAKNKKTELIEFGDYFKILAIALTSKCNLACQYCLGSQANRVGKTSDWKIIKESIDYIAKQKKPVIVLFTSAGEHTMETKLLKKTLDYMDQKLILEERRISLNGTMNPKVYLSIIDRFDRFNISCDGPPEIQNLQRPMKNKGKSSIKIENTFRELLKNNKYFSVAVVLTEKHAGLEKKTFKYFHDLGVKEIGLSAIGDLGDGKEYIKNKKLNKKNVITSMLKIKELCDEFGIFSTIVVEKAWGHRKQAFCPIGNTFALGIDGTVCGCITYSDENDLKIHPGMDKIILGKFNHTKNKFEMNEKRIKELREKHKKSDCSKCNLRFCWGGCPVRNLRSGKIEKPYKTFCESRKILANELMKYLMNKEVIAIKPCLLEKKGVLHYSMQFNDFKLSAEKIGKKIKGSAFIKFVPEEKRLRELFEKMIAAKNKKISLFVLSPKKNELNEKESVLLKEFCYALKKNKILFKISKPLKIVDFSKEREIEFYEEFGIPQNCFDCLEMFKLKEKTVVFCNGVKGPNINRVFNRREIFSNFEKNRPKCQAIVSANSLWCF